MQRTTEQRPRWIAATWPYHSVAEQPRRSSVRLILRTRGHRLEPCDRAPPIDDQHWRAGFEAVNQGAQVILCLGNARDLYSAKLVFSYRLFELGMCGKCAVDSTAVRSSPQDAGNWEEVTVPHNTLGGRQGIDERIVLREQLRRIDMMVALENRLGGLVRLYAPLPPAKYRQERATTPSAGEDLR